MKTMILLVGEQPVPNLLPVHRIRPDAVVLVYTPLTKQRAQNLKKVIAVDQCYMCEVDPYTVPITQKQLEQFLQEKCSDHTLVFNVTGGTKPMAFAAFSIAQKHNAPLVYLQTQEEQSLLYEYEVDNCSLRLKAGTPISLPPSVTIKDYLTLYLGDYQVAGFENEFEKAVYNALQPYVDEILAGVRKGGALQIDLVIRCGNRVGIAEVKTGGKAGKKEGIDQLNTAGGREFLGIYTKKFLIVDRPWDTLSNLRELAEARSITVVEVPSYGKRKEISEEDQRVLVERIQQVLRCSRD